MPKARRRYYTPKSPRGAPYPLAPDFITHPKNTHSFRIHYFTPGGCPDGPGCPTHVDRTSPLPSPHASALPNPYASPIPSPPGSPLLSGLPSPNPQHYPDPHHLLPTSLYHRLLAVAAANTSALNTSGTSTGTGTGVSSALFGAPDLEGSALTGETSDSIDQPAGDGQDHYGGWWEDWGDIWNGGEEECEDEGVLGSGDEVEVEARIARHRGELWEKYSPTRWMMAGSEGPVAGPSNHPYALVLSPLHSSPDRSSRAVVVGAAEGQGGAVIADASVVSAAIAGASTPIASACNGPSPPSNSNSPAVGSSSSVRAVPHYAPSAPAPAAPVPSSSDSSSGGALSAASLQSKAQATARALPPCLMKVLEGIHDGGPFLIDATHDVGTAQVPITVMCLLLSPTGSASALAAPLEMETMSAADQEAAFFELREKPNRIDKKRLGRWATLIGNYIGMDVSTGDVFPYWLCRAHPIPLGRPESQSGDSLRPADPEGSG